MHLHSRGGKAHSHHRRHERKQTSRYTSQKLHEVGSDTTFSHPSVSRDEVTLEAGGSQTQIDTRGGKWLEIVPSAKLEEHIQTSLAGKSTRDARSEGTACSRISCRDVEDEMEEGEAAESIILAGGGRLLISLCL